MADWKDSTKRLFGTQLVAFISNYGVVVEVKIKVEIVLGLGSAGNGEWIRFIFIPLSCKPKSLGIFSPVLLSECYR